MFENIDKGVIKLEYTTSPTIQQAEGMLLHNLDSAILFNKMVVYIPFYMKVYNYLCQLSVNSRVTWIKAQNRRK